MPRRGASGGWLHGFVRSVKSLKLYMPFSVCLLYLNKIFSKFSIRSQDPALVFAYCVTSSQ